MIVFAPIVLGLALGATVSGANLRKSRMRQCRAGLVIRAIVDRLGRKMTVCVKPTPPGILDPLHTAKRELGDATHVLKVPGPKGPEYIASHSVPQKTTLGRKLDRILHPLQHFLDDEVHAIAVHPESRGLGHDPEAAYHHAVGKVVIRGAEGEPYAVVHAQKRDAQGHPTLYRLTKLPEYQRRRMGRGKNDPDERTFYRGGGGTDITPAELEYVQRPPPRTGVAVGPSGEVFAKWQRLARPAVDSDGQAIPGRPAKVRYDILLHPSVYGGQEGYETLQSAPGWDITEDEPVADARFRDYMDLARRRFFARETDRPASGAVDELIRQHNGDIGQVIESGDLGHENVVREFRKQHLVSGRKPITPRDLTKLVALWRAQHPGLVEAARQEIRRKHAGFNDDALFDEAVDRGIEEAIHRYAPKVGRDFTRYARSLLRNRLRDAVQRGGAEYGALQEAAASPLRSFHDDHEGPDDDGADEPRASGSAGRFHARPATPSRKTLRIYDRTLGSQAEFGKVLEDVLPEDAETRRVMAALYPTGNFVAGAAYKEASEKTGLPQERFFQYLPVVQRIKQHPSYQRYRDLHFRAAEEERDEAEALSRALGAEAPPLLRVVSAIEGELRHFQLAKRLRGARTDE